VAGGSLTYTIVVENTGQQSATGGVVSDTLPAELNFVGPVTLDPPSAGTPGGALPTLATGLTIATGQRVTLTFPVTVALGTPYDTALVNTAAVTCTQVSAPATGAVTATVHAPLFIEKTVDDPEPQPGQAITYTIRVQNKGLAATTGGIVSDTLPAGLNFVGPITLDPPSAGTPGTAPPTLASGLTLGPGDAVTITLPVTIGQDLEYGTAIKNTAAVTSAQVPTPQEGSVTITLMAEVYLPLVLRSY
jgi:uncharacterized repeat protein (TIGR01451 family)